MHQAIDGSGVRCRQLQPLVPPQKSTADATSHRRPPSVSVPVDLDGARKVCQLVVIQSAREDSDDVQNAWTNVDVPDGVLARA